MTALRLVPMLMALSGHLRLGVWVDKGLPGEWSSAASVLSEAGVDHVLPCLLYGVSPAYPSSLVPASGDFEPDTGWADGLIAECRARGIEVHAWVVLWKANRADSVFLASLAREGRLQVDSSGDTLPWLCPTDPRNLELEESLVLEMMDRFPLDGVQLDYIRFPGEGSCYCRGCRNRFSRSTGLYPDAWPEDVLPGGSIHGEFYLWRAGRITHALILLSLAVRNRGAAVSAAVLPDYQDALSCGQDWVSWGRLGVLDRIYFMDYFRTAAEMRGVLEDQLERLPRGAAAVCGLGAGIGRLEISSEEARRQVETAMETGFEGVCLFHLNQTLLRMLPAITP
jgi:uncharacterized lipoprotein YddW (UPF0748 family)